MDAPTHLDPTDSPLLGASATPRWAVAATVAIVALTGTGAGVSLQDANPDQEPSVSVVDVRDPDALHGSPGGWQSIAVLDGLFFDVRTVSTEPLTTDE